MLRLSLIAILGLVLAACSPEHENNDTRVITNWKPEDVRITCPSHNCPEGVGAMIFTGQLNGRQVGQRCTATLIGADTILTNSHCDKGLDRYDSGYFFFTDAGGATRFVPVVASLYDTGSPATEDIEAGMLPDLSIHQLAARLPIQPRVISRSAPNPMPELIGFMINESGWPKSFREFELNRENCKTVRHQPHFKGGALDDSIGLSMFDCQVIQGNSGSPLFAADDYDHVQAVMNTVYEVPARPATKVSAAEPQERFGMANRVHCMDLPGLTKPAGECHRQRYEESDPAGGALTAGVVRSLEHTVRLQTDDVGFAHP